MQNPNDYTKPEIFVMVFLAVAAVSTIVLTAIMLTYSPNPKPELDND